MNQAIVPAISEVITLPWVRGSVLGLRFGTPIPTQVRLCYHPQHDHWLEFSDGTRADVVASRYPEEIRQARLEMMKSYQRREVISSTYHRRKSEAAIRPPTDSDARPRFLREGMSQMTSTEAIRRAAAGGAVQAEGAPASGTETEPGAGPAAATNPFEVFDQFSEPPAPPQPADTPSSVFRSKTDLTTRRLNALKASRLGRKP